MAKRMVAIAVVVAMFFAMVIFAGSDNETGVDVRSPKLQMSSTAIPKMISYQGVLTDVEGNPLDTTVSMTFTIYDASSGGTALWTETHGFVTVTAGVFSVLLGSITPIPTSVFDQPDRWLGLVVGGDPEMDRERILSVPYAYTCGSGDADWTIDGNNIYREPGNVGIGTATPAEKLDVSGDINASSFYKIGGNTVLSNPGTENIFVGVGAGMNNTASDGTFIGYEAGRVNQGDSNTFVGSGAGSSNTTGDNNTFLGMYAGNDNTTAVFNTFVGTSAGPHNTTGSYNTFLGAAAGNGNSTASNNTFVGMGAGNMNTTGSENTFVGSGAGSVNTTGNNNTFLGVYAGNDNTIGMFNTFVGISAGPHNTTGDYNTFLGAATGNANSTGINNTYVGMGAGNQNTTGSENTFVGTGAGSGNTTGSGNVCIGNDAGRNETGSNKLYIANGRNESDVLIYGDFSVGNVGIGTIAPAHPLHMGSGAHCTAGGVWTNASSIKYKENVTDLPAEEALEALECLNPVIFNYKVDREEQYVGFIAEETPDLVATKDRKGLSPMDIVAVLTKVVQEQQKTIEELRNDIAELKRQ